MPDTFSASVGISVLAGIISGVCYVIVYRNKITNKRNKQWHCTVCGKNFKSTDLVLSNSELVVECSKCNSKICKSKCSFLEPNDLYICRTCYNKTNNWINGAFKVIEPITKVLRAKMSYSENSNNEYMDNLEATREKEQVRDFIERLVNNILGENVDDACINKIYDDSNYLPIVGESPRSANSSLKLIIQKIIREAAGLPKLKGEGTNEASEQEKRTYEDLLSTAILNKIISSSQSNLTSRSSRANSVSSHRSTSSRRKKYHKEYFFGEEAINNKWKDTDTASVSSLDEWVHSDSSLGSTKYVDRLSLTIKQRIEEVSSSESDQEADLEENNDAEYFGTQSYLNVDDQPNWFLQRRKFRGGAISPVPVPMLVPDPTNEAKVLIGDKELDDTSDLSDIPSDFEEEINKNVLSMDIKNHLIGSKNLIGGKNSLADLSLVLSDDDVSADSGVKECKDLDDVDSEMFVSNKHDRENADESICSDESNNERDLEYTERYATLPRTILISPKAERKLDDSTKAQKNDNIQTNGLKGEAEEKNESEFTGLYSRREKKKWKNAVELKNNPYSKENIEKRIKSRNSINSLFGSDYYVRQASLPSGAKKSEVQVPTTFKDENQNSLKNEEIPTENLNLQEECENSLQNSDTEQFSEITSDSDVSLVNCYDVSQSVIYKTISKNDDEEIQTAEQILSFESTDTLINSSEETKIEDSYKPVAKPRKLINAGKPAEISFGMETVKLTKFKDLSENTFEDTPFIINKRSDNTLIRKIYSNPSVRTFALNKRNKLPIEIEKNEIKLAQSKKEINDISQKLVEKNRDDFAEVRLTSSPLNGNVSKLNKKLPYEKNDDDDLSIHKENLDDEEINKLKKQRLVANRLKIFSKSSNNLTVYSEERYIQKPLLKLRRNQSFSKDTQNEPKRKIPHVQNIEKSTSVRDLRKKFEKFDYEAKSEKNILYSLTGRSISKQFKEKLRDLDETTPSLSQFRSLSLTNLEVEENTR